MKAEHTISAVLGAWKRAALEALDRSLCSLFYVMNMLYV